MVIRLTAQHHPLFDPTTIQPRNIGTRFDRMYQTRRRFVRKYSRSFLLFYVGLWIGSCHGIVNAFVQQPLLKRHTLLHFPTQQSPKQSPRQSSARMLSKIRTNDKRKRYQNNYQKTKLKYKSRYKNKYRTQYRDQ